MVRYLILNSLLLKGFARLLSTTLLLVVLASFNILAQKTPATAKMDYNKTPTYGSISLNNTTLGADPHKLTITSGGAVNSNYLGGDCSGFVSEAPDYRVSWNGTTSKIAFYFEAKTAGQDATILVNLPDGSWRCNDDISSDELNPMVIIENPATGQYDIWVGSYETGKFIEGTLMVTDVNKLNTNKSTEKLDFSLEPHYGSVSLRAGFSADPHSVTIKTGGEVDVKNLNLGTDCTGFAAKAPDFRLTWSGTTNQLRVYFEADKSGEDAVLVINTPSGQWLCNDDASSGTLNPLLLLGSQQEGQFDIWVASLSSGTYIDGKLIITERDRKPR